MVPMINAPNSSPILEILMIHEYHTSLRPSPGWTCVWFVREMKREKKRERGGGGGEIMFAFLFI